MILTYHEGACIRASAGDTTVVFGPVSKKSKNFKPVNFGTDIALVALNHPDMNAADEAARGEKEPFAVIGAGEYEISGITIAGFGAKSSYGAEAKTSTKGGSSPDATSDVAFRERINTVYALTFDGISLLYLGALGSSELPAELLEMDAPDVLFVPISGEGTLGPSEAQKLAVKLEAKIVIPILYTEKTLKQFLKEAGEENVKPVDKLTIKPRDIVGKEGDVVVLSS